MEDKKECTCPKAMSELFTDIFKSKIDFVDVACPIHGNDEELIKLNKDRVKNVLDWIEGEEE